MSKAKVGDKVRVTNTISPREIIYVGEEITVTTAVNGGIGGYTKDGTLLCFADSEFEIVEGDRSTQKIVITTDGKEVLARLYKGGKVIGRATAKCSPRDKFDFQTGAKIAFDRLTGREEPEKAKGPKFLNGKFVCVERLEGLCPCAFTPGKIYEVKDGVITSDIGTELGGKEHNSYEKPDGWYMSGGLWQTGWRFIELKED